MRRERSRGGPESLNLAGKLIGKADATIAALSGATAGSGTVSIWGFLSPGSSVLEDTGRNVTAYNIGSASIEANVFLQLLPEQLSGRWLIDFQDCETA